MDTCSLSLCSSFRLSRTASRILTSEGVTTLTSIAHHSFASSGPSQQTPVTTPPLTRTYTSQSYNARSPTRQLHGSTGPGYHTKIEAGHYQQPQYGYRTGVDVSRDGTSAGFNYTTGPYGSPSAHSYPSAHASMTTASGGSPYPQQNHQAQNSYPFTPSSPRQYQNTTSSGATGQLPQYPVPRRSVASLPIDVQSTIQSLDRTYILTNLKECSNDEQLDTSKQRDAWLN